MTIIDPYENPDNVPDEVTAIIEEAAPEYTDLNLKRRFRLIGVLGVAVLAMVALLVLRTTVGKDENTGDIKKLTALVEAQQELIDKLAIQLDTAIDQGADVPTPEVIAEDVPDAEVSPPVGETGERGDAGAPGAPGTGGLPGSQGEPGDTGATGGTGVRGPQGEQGDPGTNGVNGAPGATGAKGDQGDPGPPGAQGPQGATGPQGDTGGMPGVYHFVFNGVAYTCSQAGSGSTTYNCNVD